MKIFNFGSLNRILALRVVAIMGGLLVGFISSCSKPSPANPKGDKLSIFASIPPYAYFAEQIGGTHVEVSVLVGANQNPHFFEPTIKQAKSLSSANLFVRSGMPFEKSLVQKISKSNSNLQILDINEGLKLGELEGGPCQSEHHENEHGDADGHHSEHADAHDHHHHEEESLDPHTWLCPINAKIQATNIQKALAALAPEHAAEFKGNLDKLTEALDALHVRLQTSLAPFKGSKFFVYHPAFGYFAKTYGLKQVAVEHEGKPPSLRQIKDLIDKAKAENVRLIFVQPGFPVDQAARMAQAVEGRVIPLNPLAGDYVVNMERIADTLAKGMQGASQ